MKNILAVYILFICLFLVNAADFEIGEDAPLEFSHQIHVVQEELECIDCHEQAEQSSSGLDNLFPARSICMDCHDESESDKIGDPLTLPAITGYSEKFSHQQHIEADQNCLSCHEGVVEKEMVAEYLLPDMNDCVSCHMIKAADVMCNTCHLESEQLLPASHLVSNFTHNHADLSREGAISVSSSRDCASCHQPQFCQSCHEGDNLDRLSHPLNFEFTHSLVAQAKEQECASCHVERQFCIDCHRDNNVLPRNHAVGWTNRIPNDGGRHRVEAMIDLDACMACHEQNAQQFCESCHGK